MFLTLPPTERRGAKTNKTEHGAQWKPVMAPAAVAENPIICQHRVVTSQIQTFLKPPRRTFCPKVDRF